MFRKSVFILFSLISLAALAGDSSPFQPAVDQPICLKRVYTARHLAQHPGQNLEELHVLLTREIHRYTDENGEKNTSDWTIASVSGRSPRYGNTLYTNEFGCEFNKDGSAKCYIECDGGSFTLKSLNGGREAQLKVSSGYYWHLFKEGFSEEGGMGMEDPGNTLEFESTDKENEVYRLEVVPAAECIWERPAKAVSAGC